MCSRYGQTTLSVSDFAEYLGAFQYLVAMFLNIDELAHVVRYRRGVDYESVFYIFRDEVDVVLVVYVDALLLERVRQLGFRLVISGDIQSLEFEVSGNRAHADATDTYEIYVLICSCHL